MLSDTVRPAAAAEARLAQLEQALREAQDRAEAAERRLLEQASPGMLLVDAAGRIERLNDALCQLLALGEGPGPWLGQPAAVFFEHLQALTAQPAEYARRLAEQRRLQQNVAAEEIPLRDGRVLTQDYVLMPVRGAARTELFTFRLRPAVAVAVLQAHELGPLLASLAAPALLHDLSGRLLTGNAALARLLGYEEPAALVGRRLSELLPAEPPDAAAAYLAQFDRVAAATEGLLGVLTSAGQPRPLRYHAQRLDPPRQAAYVLLCACDLTEQVQAEAELRRAKDKAEASAKAKENFLANLSHEIRTPMNGVLGMARQLTKTQLDQGQRELLRIIQNSGEHLLAVLNEVLDMTKISSARLELEQLSFDLRYSIEEAMRPLAVQAAEKGLAFHATLLVQAEPLPRVVGDAYRLNQVLINLVSNAIKFTPPEGSISVGGYLVSQSETHLTTGFRVTDTGIGIAADKIDHIFEDFVQADVDTARRYGGTGLGLGIARALVEQMGGNITVESQLGSGSTFYFTVTLPIAQGLEVAPRPVLTDTGALRNRRVLVVEDNEINREVVRLLLRAWGVQVDEAADGAAALVLHAEHRYDAILMDIQMPGMSGVEATAQLRLHPDPARAQVPVLALTANAFRADLDRYLKAGINDCLTKPFQEDEFYRKLVALVQTPEPPLYNLAQVHELADGEEVFVERVVRSFLLHMPPVLEQIQTAAAAGQWEQVAKLVHHVKPNLLQFGVAGIAQALQLLMAAPAAGRKAGKAHTAAVQQLVQQVERVLAALPAELPAGS